MSCLISLYLDTRRVKKNGLFPVKLQVYSELTKQNKLHSIGINISKEDFSDAWEKQKNVKGKNHQELRIKLSTIVKRAADVAEAIEVFTHEEFERKFFRFSNSGHLIKYHYDLIIEEYQKRRSYSTASMYANSLKHLIDFGGKDLSFFLINEKWLNDFENSLLNEHNKSRTTASIYLRCLRAAFNKAISSNDIPIECYPFSKKQYQIPAVRKVKKSLSHEQISILKNATGLTSEQELARDFWLISFCSNGANINDIIHFTLENIQSDRIIFYRGKTINSGKTDITPVIVYITPLLQTLIEKHGSKSDSDFIFPILTNRMSHKEQWIKKRNFIRFMNQHLKKIATKLDLPIGLSSNWARHSFATIAIRNGGSMEFVSEALNHKSLKTTQNYFSGFEDSAKMKLMLTLTDI